MDETYRLTRRRVLMSIGASFICGRWANAGRAVVTTRVRSLPLFEGVLLGGFECSCHKLVDGRRIDMAIRTRHEELAAGDYARLRSIGVTAARDGVPWVHAERASGSYDFSRVLPIVQAAERYGVTVIWDLMHFGWPDDVDVFAPSFSSRFGRYASAFAKWLAHETDRTSMFTPINEMSFLSWAGGDARVLNPYETGRGVELKIQLVRATIEAIEAVRSVFPEARFMQPEPVINIVPPPEQPNIWARVEAQNVAQYQAWDMLSGRMWPGLGGKPDYLDILGVNFYPNNQFTTENHMIPLGDPRYKPFSSMLLDVWARYGRPMIVSETGSEGDDRGPWLRYVSEQCIAALREGCELHGVTWYPIVNHPGWLDDRHCHNGLWDYPDGAGNRRADGPFLEEIDRQTPHLKAARARMLEQRLGEPPAFQALHV